MSKSREMLLIVPGGFEWARLTTKGKITIRYVCSEWVRRLGADPQRPGVYSIKWAINPVKGKK